VVNLIGSPTTPSGLPIKAALEGNAYTPGSKITDEGLATRAIGRDPFHGEGHYRWMPRDRHAQP
jgi:hypothetical protein